LFARKAKYYAVPQKHRLNQTKRPEYPTKTVLGDIPQPFDTPNSYIGQSVIDDLIASFNGTSDYSIFYGGTSGGTEGGWYGFKHSIIGEGIFLCRYIYKPFYFIIEYGVITFYRI